MSTVDEIIPPIIGAAIRLMTSESVPLSLMIGIRPAMVVTTVMNLGRTRPTAPSIKASYRHHHTRPRRHDQDAHRQHHDGYQRRAQVAQRAVGDVHLAACFNHSLTLKWRATLVHSSVCVIPVMGIGKVSVHMNLRGVFVRVRVLCP